MLIHALTESIVKANFPERFYERGEKYYRQGLVENVHIVPLKKGERIKATVQGSEPYDVIIELSGTTNRMQFRGVCDCPIAINCKHVIATLLHALHYPPEVPEDIAEEATEKTPPAPLPMELPIDHSVEHWLFALEKSLTQEVQPINKVDDSYLLFFQIMNSHEPKVQPVLVRQLANGGLGKPKKLNLNSSSQAKHLTESDKAILIKLQAHYRMHSSSYYYYGYQLNGEDGESLLEEMLATHKTTVEANMVYPYSEGPTREGKLKWEMDKQGNQRARLSVEGQNVRIFIIENLWYIDPNAKLMGKITTDLNKDIIKQLLVAPKIPPHYIQKVSSLLSHEKLRHVPPPLAVEGVDQLCVMVPHLHIEEAEIKLSDVDTHSLPLISLSFDYNGNQITWQHEEDVIIQIEAGIARRIRRDKPKERLIIDTLTEHNVYPIKYLDITSLNPSLKDKFVLLRKDPNECFHFTLKVLPTLKQAGWQISIADNYSYKLLEDPIDEWYTDIDESSGIDWFGLELGITVNQEKINLIPLLHDLIPKLATLDLNQMESIIVPLPDHKGGILLPVDRIKNILTILIELYDSKGLSTDKKLLLSKWQAARLQDLDDMFEAHSLRWMGGDRLRELGKKLSSFAGIQMVKPADGFKGALRPYQEEGLSWIQFLREYELGGILADDMGLGKTVQTIAHIQLEKESGRMQHPVLVVAPTTLMFNWFSELQRFAPQLKVLTSHGANRDVSFAKMSEYDVVLTTYPLLVRDREVLLQQQFYLCILDEAQVIKNAKSQAAQVAALIKTCHRLCVTGTPMENHLGELWSLFHFMMPGFLGDTTTFQRLFRTPIEKYNNQDRRLQLKKRVAPFLLRRTKDKVIRELPDKIEMIRHVELEGAQRDLYETIRATMQKKIKDQIAKAGMARSQIIILDALLKLRQVCCDPRLLKIASTKNKKYTSAKLELLISLLTELLEEGRRVLIFSQFAEMIGLIEEEFEKNNMQYVKITGSTTDRRTPVERFQSGEVPLFLISLKAGGTGLNLTAADTVIHYDPWWNPAVENQATDRAHRIGQDKTVFVYKLITKGTLEEKMVEMQQKKLALMQGLFEESKTSALKLTEEDLQILFNPLT